MTGNTGNVNKRRPRIPRRPLPHPRPLRPNRRQIPRQTHFLRRLLPILLPPNRRIHTLPTPQFHTRGRHARVFGGYGREGRTAASLAVF